MPVALYKEIIAKVGGSCTYSTCLDHSGGSLNVMNIQLVKIVHMMIMLNNVRRQELRKTWPALLHHKHFTNIKSKKERFKKTPGTLHRIEIEPLERI